MPVSMTKNAQSEETLRRIAEAAKLPDIIDITELTEGYFNVAYSIKTAGGDYIIKIAPSPDCPIMTHEINIMESEVRSMQMVAERLPGVPVAKIICYDNSRTLCTSDYFIMERLHGTSFSSIMNTMTTEETDAVYRKLGEYNREINSITGSRFGYFGQPDKQGDDWFTVFRSMICDALDDAARMNIKHRTDPALILGQLDRDKEYFLEITVPRFVHWDLWAGNVFIADGKITGLIDFERCLWGDVLLEASFRTYDPHPAFLAGYGIDTLTKAELRRAKWYDIYLFLISCLECDYRHYDNRFAYEWGSDMTAKYIKEFLS